jgi:hypothetical protein
VFFGLIDFEILKKRPLSKSYAHQIPSEGTPFRKLCAPDSIYKASNGLVDENNMSNSSEKPISWNFAHKSVKI